MCTTASGSLKQGVVCEKEVKLLYSTEFRPLPTDQLPPLKAKVLAHKDLNEKQTGDWFDLHSHVVQKADVQHTKLPHAAVTLQDGDATVDVEVLGESLLMQYEQVRPRTHVLFHGVQATEFRGVRKVTSTVS